MGLADAGGPVDETPADWVHHAMAMAGTARTKIVHPQEIWDYAPRVVPWTAAARDDRRLTQAYRQPASACVKLEPKVGYSQRAK